MAIGEYLAACVVLGLGISIDVAIATVSRFRQLSDAREARRWIFRITLTHTAFPMLGYYPVALYVLRLERLQFVAGIIAAALVFYFVVRAYLSWRRGEAGDVQSGGASWALVLAVSWDALFSGPAKAAQALHWSDLEVLLSFFIAGGVVAAASIASVAVARGLVASSLAGGSSARLMAIKQTAGFAVEIGVLAYFGVLAVARLSFQWNGSWVALLGATVFFVGILFYFDRRELISGRAKAVLASNAVKSGQSSPGASSDSDL